MSDHILATEWLTTRDVLLLPNCSSLTSRSDVELVPFIYSAPMDTVTGYKLAVEMLNQGERPVVSRFISEEERLATLRELGPTDTFFAVGFDDAESFIHTARDVIPNHKINVALDVAHGDMRRAHETTKALSEMANVRRIMSGSICTSGAATRAHSMGCTDLRVGVGPGAACTTRIMTGIGAPQLSAVYRIATELRYHANIIADGGIRDPGDAVKYLAAGASGIMMGGVFSKCIEAPGWEEKYRGSGDTVLYKTYRGQASAAFQKSVYGEANHCPEGASSIPFRYEGDTVQTVIQKFRGGVRSGCSYLGVRELAKISNHNPQFIKITASGWQEGTAHGV